MKNKYYFLYTLDVPTRWVSSSKPYECEYPKNQFCVGTSYNLEDSATQRRLSIDFYRVVELYLLQNIGNLYDNLVFIHFNFILQATLPGTLSEVPIYSLSPGPGT